MGALMRAEVTKIARRRALLVTATAIQLAVVVALFVIAYVFHVRDAAENPSVGGGSGMDSTAASISALALILGSLIGARAGAYDGETQIVRYWAMTGLPRWRLLAVRLPAACVVALMTAIPAFLLGVGASAVLPAESGDALSVGGVGSAAWSAVLALVLWTALAVGIGALLGSTGAGIAVALAVAIVGAPAVAALELLWSPLGALPLGNAQSVLSGSDDAYGPVVVALLVAVAWVAIPMLGAAARLRRAEL